MNFDWQRRFKVLIVEDDKDMSEITANFLKDHFGFDLTLACCGEEAICLLNSANDFDLIITDYYMPNGSGKDILDHMNQSKIDTPVILSPAEAMIIVSLIIRRFFQSLKNL